LTHLKYTGFDILDLCFKDVQFPVDTLSHKRFSSSIWNSGCGCIVIYTTWSLSRLERLSLVILFSFCIFCSSSWLSEINLKQFSQQLKLHGEHRNTFCSLSILWLIPRDKLPASQIMFWVGLKMLIKLALNSWWLWTSKLFTDPSISVLLIQE